MQQAITWANIDLDLCCHMASLCQWLKEAMRHFGMISASCTQKHIHILHVCSHHSQSWNLYSIPSQGKNAIWYPFSHLCLGLKFSPILNKVGNPICPSFQWPLNLWKASCLYPQRCRLNRFGYRIPISLSSAVRSNEMDDWPVDIGIKENMYNTLFNEWITQMILFIWSQHGPVYPIMQIILTNMLKPCNQMNFIIIRLTKPKS